MVLGTTAASPKPVAWGRWAIRAVGLAAAALMLGSCQPQGAPRDAAGGVCTVGVVGDSLTVGAERSGQLRQRLAEVGCEVSEIDARVGRPTSEGVAVVDRWRAEGRLPSILVVALGTNDCNPTVFGRHANRIVDLAAGRPVVWVDTWRPRCDAAINNAIAQIAATRSIWVLPERNRLAANPGHLARDGIHLTTEGYRERAAALARFVVGQPV